MMKKEDEISSFNCLGMTLFDRPNGVWGLMLGYLERWAVVNTQKHSFLYRLYLLPMVYIFKSWMPDQLHEVFDLTKINIEIKTNETQMNYFSLLFQTNENDRWKCFLFYLPFSVCFFFWILWPRDAIKPNEPFLK